jgi:NADPH:quinone reductase-like Zn-dependent oxidoreductase
MFVKLLFLLFLSAQIQFMIREKILVIGASGQIGVELTLALRKMYGNTNVIASDLREQNPLLEGTGPYVSLDVMNKEMLHVQVIRQNITQIYLLAAILSATGEKNPNLAWNLNMTGLLNVLDIAREAPLLFSVPHHPNKIARSKRLLNQQLSMASANMQASFGVTIIFNVMLLM